MIWLNVIIPQFSHMLCAFLKHTKQREKKKEARNVGSKHLFHPMAIEPGIN